MASEFPSIEKYLGYMVEAGGHPGDAEAVVSHVRLVRDEAEAKGRREALAEVWHRWQHEVVVPAMTGDGKAVERFWEWVIREGGGDGE